MNKIDSLAELIEAAAYNSLFEFLMRGKDYTATTVNETRCGAKATIAEAIQAAIDERIKAVVGGRLRSLEQGMPCLE